MRNRSTSAALFAPFLALLLGCSPGVGDDQGVGGSSSGTNGTSSGKTSGSGTGSASGGSTGSLTTTGSSTGVGSAAGGSGGAGNGGASTTSASTSSTAESSSSSSSTGSGGMQPVAEVFGQTASTLYRLDPDTKEVTKVGDFNGCFGEAVIDIALNKAGGMYATTADAFYKVDKTTAICTLVSFGSFPNSLSFVPAGTVDPSVEALVGYNGSTYVRIDLNSGVESTIGSLGNAGYSSSGDVVSVIGGGTYLTVTGGPQNCGDCIVEVDPKTGSLKNFIGKLGHAEVYGLAFWGGVAYGFDAGGELFQIDLTSGNSTVIPIPNATNPTWYGAGSTTSARLTTN